MKKLLVLGLLVSMSIFCSDSFAQTNAFTDGLSWVSTGISTTATSPVYSSTNCSDIHYSISTTSSLGFKYESGATNGTGVIFPGNATASGNTINISITFNVPVANFGMRILDLDEDNQHDGGAPEEYLSGISPAPGSVTTLNGINPIFISGNTVTPNDGNSSNANNNTGGWVYWSGQVTTISFTYNRANTGYEFVLDSIHFECPCPAPQNYIEDAYLCPDGSIELDATSSSATSYLWNTGSTNATIDVTSAGTYWVKVFVESCIEYDTAIVSLIPTPDLDLGSDTSICEGMDLTLSINPLFDPVLWQDSSTTSSITVNTSGTYYVSGMYNYCILHDTITVTTIAYPVIDLGNDTSICEGSTLSLNAFSTGCTYLWSDGSILPNNTISSAGTFWVDVARATCVSSDSITVSLKPLPPNPLPSDTVLCIGDTVTFTLYSPSNLITYDWFNGSSENTFTTSEAGSYWVTSYLNGCARTDTLYVSQYPVIADAISVDSVLVICEDKNTLIGPTFHSSLIDILWETGATSASIVVSDSGTYHFTVYTPCESYDYSIHVEEERCFCSVYLPNAFTPDNKFGNEVFQAKYDCPLDRFELLIFNRWGELVYESQDPDGYWDGTYKNLPVPDGVYVYKLMYTSSETSTYKEMAGHVCVLR